MNSLALQIEAAVLVLQNNIWMLLLFMGLLWGIHCINWLLNYRLNILGIYPRHFSGLIGIIFAPFLHADFNHLFFNSIPLFVLGSFVTLNGWHNFWCVTLLIIALSGFGIWLVGRRGIHIGASALIMGYWSYLLLNAFTQGTLLAFVLAGVCLYYFGGLVLHLFPTEVRSSWEGHLCGFVAGVIAAYVGPML